MSDFTCRSPSQVAEDFRRLYESEAKIAYDLKVELKVLQERYDTLQVMYNNCKDALKEQQAMAADHQFELNELREKLDAAWIMAGYWRKFGPMDKPKFKTRVVIRQWRTYREALVQRKRFGIWFNQKFFNYDQLEEAKTFAQRLALGGNGDEIVEAYE